jgi:hypothetical protein
MKVRDAIREIEDDGWYHVATRGIGGIRRGARNTG